MDRGNKKGTCAFCRVTSTLETVINVFEFELDEDPFSGDKYRCEVIEEVYLGSTVYWTAEVWNIDAPPYHFAGSKTVNSVSLVNTYEIEIPPLSGSRILFGAGSGGQMDLELLGTAAFIY